jgi:hypothetical protein
MLSQDRWFLAELKLGTLPSTHHQNMLRLTPFREGVKVKLQRFLIAVLVEGEPLARHFSRF